MEEVPFEDRYIPKVEIDWGRSFWWWYPISRAVQPAVRMTSLLLSIVAIVLLEQGLSLAETWFSPSFSILRSFSWSIAWNGSPVEATNFPQLTLQNIAYVTFAMVWIALIVSFFGGVLARRAAVELGQRTVAPWIRSVQLVGSRIVSYLWAAALHLIGLVAILLPIAVLGWFAGLGSVASAIAGVIMIVVCIPLIFAVGRLVLSLVLCYPFSVCAISIEKRADAFEGFSRSNAYFFQRPVLTVLCVALLVVFGEIGAQLVSWTVGLGWGLLSATYASGSGETGVETSAYLNIGQRIAANLVIAFRFSYFWSAAAGLYLVLRKCVDNTDLDEMDVLESEIERNPPQIPTTSQPANKEVAATDSSSSEAMPSGDQTAGSSD